MLVRDRAPGHKDAGEDGAPSEPRITSSYTRHVARRLVSARRDNGRYGPTDGRTHPLIELRTRN